MKILLLEVPKNHCLRIPVINPPPLYIFYWWLVWLLYWLRCILTKKYHWEIDETWSVTLCTVLSLISSNKKERTITCTKCDIFHSSIESAFCVRCRHNYKALGSIVDDIFQTAVSFLATTNQVGTKNVPEKNLQKVPMAIKTSNVDYEFMLIVIINSYINDYIRSFMKPLNAGIYICFQNRKYDFWHILI